MGVPLGSPGASDKSRLGSCVVPVTAGFVSHPLNVHGTITLTVVNDDGTVGFDVFLGVVLVVVLVGLAGDFLGDVPIDTECGVLGKE